ncbi:MAG: hypothetical protein QGF03_08560, partial [SAR324 cluster bacterium]|nr:hypothetical protein [SAR324 cluster bacterium]
MQELTDMRNMVESRITDYLLKNSERIREDAVQEGKEERPATNDKRPDRHQMQIQSGFQQIQDKLQTPFTDLKSKIQKRMEERLVARSKPEPEPVYTQFLHLVSIEKLKAADQLAQKRRTERKRMLELREFRRANNLIREANYPLTVIYHFGVMVLILAVEAAINSGFFAAASPYGLSGGFTQALVISFINVAFSFIFGWKLLPLFHHIELWRRGVGTVAMMGYVLLIGALALITAHYRAALTLSPESADSFAFERLVEDPMGIGAVASLFLIFVTLIIAVIGCMDGYAFDDPYPGYGRVYRSHMDSREDYEETREILRDAILEVGRRTVNEYEARISEVKSQVLELQVDHEQLKTLEQSAGELQQRIVRNYGILVQLYQEENQQARTSNSPKHFNTPEPLALFGVTDAEDRFTSRIKGVTKELEILRDQMLVLRD